MLRGNCSRGIPALLYSGWLIVTTAWSSVQESFVRSVSHLAPMTMLVNVSRDHVPSRVVGAWPRVARDLVVFDVR